jgi:hypothetical protein
LLVEPPFPCGEPPLEAQEASYFAAEARIVIFSPRSIKILYTGIVNSATQKDAGQDIGVYFSPN